MKSNLISTKYFTFIICLFFTFISFANLNAQKIKVFILAGQSNMQGQGDILPAGSVGTLSHFMDDGGDEEFEYIRDENSNWATREDVWVRFDNEDGDFINGDLAIGYGADANKIGPELGFGHLLGEDSDDQILIIKTCWGGKSLAVDFRPPSSGGAVGPYYTQMISDISTAINNIGQEFPEYDNQEIEIAGFCWFQGWNDGEEEAFLNEYEENVKNLITDVRSDLGMPNLPFVIGLTGNGGFELDPSDAWVQSLQTILVPAQINAAESTDLSNVKFAETRNFWKEADQSPEPDFVHHWRNNGESFLRIGIELGEQMISLLGTNDGNENSSDVFPASGYGFNYFPTDFVADNSFGAGYSFYSAVWPFMEQYPGFENFQVGQGTWVSPQGSDDTPSDFYNTIEGGLGWWGDTRFGTTTPKFIMGGVAHSFDAAANGPGAGSSDTRFDGHRDWDTPGGKYGVAQLSPNLLWAPDGLNMEQGSNGEFLGYGYHPLPLTDPMEITNGVEWATGNQCWTLFMNSTNFKGPAAFFIPTFWAATVVGNQEYEGQFLDTKSSDPNLSFAQEFSASPAIVGVDDIGDIYTRILPPVYPKTNGNSSEVMRDISIYSKSAKWNEVESWFNGGPTPSTQLQSSGTLKVNFNLDNSDPEPVNAAVWSDEGPLVDAPMNQSEYANVKMSVDKKVGIFEWDTDFIEEVDNGFIMPEFYKLTDNNEWEVTPIENVPASSGLLDNTPEISGNNENLSYITPLEPDCHLFGTDNPWNSPGPVAGPFSVMIGDGTELTYYWYLFKDQPSIIQANLPEEMRGNLQERVELIHANWKHTDEYLDAPSGGNLVSIDNNLIVTPPRGMEIGYVPIVSRQELATSVLPITLESFEVSRRKDYVQLEWSTADEINNSHFDIERSQDGSIFKRIGTKKGADNSNALQSYNSTDELPNNGRNYYRLKQVDFDGRYTYSDIKMVNFTKTITFEVHPNPSSQFISIQSNEDYESIEIIDVNGKVVLQHKGETSQISLNSIHSGIYYIKLLDSYMNQIAVEKLVVAKAN